MKETPDRFERRCGERYSPPAWLRAEARSLESREACPTLFRYPGPEGLRALLGGSLERLAPGESAALWLSAQPGHERRRAARLFGAAAVLEPLRLQPCATRRRGIYLGVNRRLRTGMQVVWVPPSALGAAIPWDRIQSADQAARRFGRGYAEERARVEDALGAYLEEIEALARAGVPLPPGAWHARSRRERTARLRDAGLTPRWTRA